MNHPTITEYFTYPLISISKETFTAGKLIEPIKPFTAICAINSDGNLMCQYYPIFPRDSDILHWHVIDSKKLLKKRGFMPKEYFKKLKEEEAGNIQYRWGIVPQWYKVWNRQQLDFKLKLPS